jgi:shikimate kinase
MRKHIFLVGFMGSGKSTICPLLADRLGWDSADLDSCIEEGEEQSISEIFKDRGEAGFRLLESRYLGTTEDWDPSVISLGGGAFAEGANRAFIREQGISVWLRVSLSVASEPLGIPVRSPQALLPNGGCSH